MIVRPTKPDDLWPICSALRPVDAHEVFATRFSDDPRDLAFSLASGLERAVLAVTLHADDDTPVALIGFWLIGPGVASANMIATTRWPEIARAADRYSRHVVMARFAPTLRRLECRSIASHDTAHRWLCSLGFQAEGLLRALGKAGEDFVQFAWINPETIRKEA